MKRMEEVSKGGNRWNWLEKITKTKKKKKDGGSCDLRKTYAKLDFKFLGATRRGLNYSKDRKPSCGWFFKKMQFFSRVMAGTLSKGGKKEKKSRRGSKSTVSSPLYFNDILRFPRVILVMLANRNQQGTFRTLGMIPARHFFVYSIGISLGARAISFEFLSKVSIIINWILHEFTYHSFT